MNIISEFAGKHTSGEVLVEYFVIFVVVAFLTLLGLTNFDDELKTTLTGYFQTASAKLVGPPSSSEDTSTTDPTRPTPIGGCCGQNPGGFRP